MLQSMQPTKDSIHNMTKKSAQALLEDIRLVSEQNYAIVEAVRAFVQKTFDRSSEEIKYGGILFTSGVQFGEVVAYKAHVAVIRSRGAECQAYSVTDFIYGICSYEDWHLQHHREVVNCIRDYEEASKQMVSDLQQMVESAGIRLPDIKESI